ncbi:MAG: Bll0480 protein, partial [uncultured Acetobacteraceae bacterium]
ARTRTHSSRRPARRGGRPGRGRCARDPHTEAAPPRLPAGRPARARRLRRPGRHRRRPLPRRAGERPLRRRSLLQPGRRGAAGLRPVPALAARRTQRALAGQPPEPPSAGPAAAPRGRRRPPGRLRGPRHLLGPRRRPQHPDRPGLVRAREPPVLRRPAPAQPAGRRVRGPAADRRRADLAQPLRPFGPFHAGAALGAGLPAANRAARERRGAARPRRLDRGGDGGLGGHAPARARRRGLARAGAPLVVARRGRPQPRALGRLRAEGGRRDGLLRRRHRLRRRATLPRRRRAPRAARSGAPPDRRLRAALVHGAPAHGPRRGGAGLRAARGAAGARLPLGHLPAHKRGRGPPGARPRGGAGRPRRRRRALPSRPAGPCLDARAGRRV